jgi:hypothetical protein
LVSIQTAMIIARIPLAAPIATIFCSGFIRIPPLRDDTEI